MGIGKPRAHARLFAALAAAGLAASAGPAHALIGVEAGGGIANYSRGLADEVSAGPAWGAALQLMATEVVGLELAYTGSSLPLEGRSGRIVQNGGDAMLRLNLATGVLKPFAFGGLGASRIDVDEDAPLNDDTVFQVPAGAGLEVDMGPVALAGRFRYNFHFDDDVTPRLVGAGADPDREGFDRWSAMLTLGARLD